MIFGVPTQRTVREEKYPQTPVITLSVNKGKGTSKSFLLNKKAVELLGLPDEGATVALSFSDNIFIANGNQAEIPEHHRIRVTKSGLRKFSDKKVYDYIVNLLKLDDTAENEFQLSSVDRVVGEPVVFEMSLIKEDIKYENNEENIEEIEIVDEEIFPDSIESEVVA